MTVSSADPADLDSFVRRTRTGRRAAHGEQRSLARRQAAVDAASVGYGATIPALDALDGQFERLRDLERFVTTVRGELLAADGRDEFGRPAVADVRLRAALDGAGLGMPSVPVEFEPGTMFGLPPTSGFVDDPICAANGNMVHQDHDLSLPGIAAALAPVRTYNSRRPVCGAFGLGWSSVLDVGLAAAPGRVEVALSDGAVAAFVRRGDRWLTAGRRLRDLHRHDGGWTIHIDHRRVLEFDVGGRLTGWSDGPARVVVDRSDGWIVSLTETVSARRIEVEWEGDRVRRLHGPTGTATYEYDDDRLVVATTPGGRLAYEWVDRRLRSVVDADGVRPFENRYDEDGRVVEQRSPFGRVTNYRYGDGLTVVTGDDEVRQGLVHDGRGNLTAVVDADGSAMRLTYDHADRMTAVVARGGATWRYRFDDDTGDLVERVDPDGLGAAWTWDWRGRLLAETHRDGAVTRYEYRGDLTTPVRITDPLGSVTHVEVDDRLDVVVAVTDADGVTTRVEHDRDGQVTAIVDGVGRRCTFEYDAAGRPVRTVDPAGLESTIDHDAAGRIVRVDAGGRLSTWSYTAAGRLASGTDPAGASWQVAYGEHGEGVRVTSGDVQVRLDHDPMGNLVALTLPDGATYHRLHDGCGRFVGTADPSGATTHLHHDVDGRVVEAVDAAGRRHRRELDALGRTVRSTGPDGATTTWTHHPGGQVATVELPDGRVWRADVDAAGRLVAVIDPAGERTELRRSPAGRVVSRRTPSGREERFEYDDTGRLAAVVDPIGRRVTIDRDGRVTRLLAGDELVAEVERDRFGQAVRRVEHGIATAIEHDGAGRVVARTDATGVRTRFEWTVDGLLAVAVDPAGGRTEYRHDGRGRLVAAVGPGGRTTSYGYGADGRVATVVDPAGAVARFRHDPTGIPTGVDRGGVGWSRDLDPAGRELRRHDLDGGLLGEFAHDVAGRLVRAATATWTTELEWDQADRPAAVVDPTGRRSIERDPDGHVTGLRVARHTAADGERRDRAGRLLLDRAGTAFAYDSAGRLVTVEPVGELPTRFEYGTDGLLAVERGPGAIRRFGYDAAGRVDTITSEGPDGGTTRFAYDVAGRRVRATTADGTVQHYRWDGADRLVAIEIVPPDGPARVVAIEHDAHGRPCRVGGRTIARDPRTGEVDQVAGRPIPGGRGPLRIGPLTFLGARVHDAVSRQFLTPDPVPAVPGSNGAASACTYAWHDPVNLVDPTGFRPISVAEFDAIRAREESGRLGMAWEAVVDDPWGSLLMAGVVVAGVALVATGAGAAVGTGILVGAGLTAGIGVATGTFDPRQVAIGGLVGGATFGVGTGGSVGWSATRTLAAHGAIGVGQSSAEQLLVDGRFSVLDAIVNGGLTAATAGAAGRLPPTFRTTATRAFLTDGAIDATGSLIRQRATGDHDVSVATAVGDGFLGATSGLLVGGAPRGPVETGPVELTPAGIVPEPSTAPLRIGPPPAGTPAEMTVVYHGAGSLADLAVHAETGVVLSDAATRTYLDSGGDLDLAHARSESAYRFAVETWGSERDYLDAIAEFGDEVTDVSGRHGVVTVTTDPAVAAAAAGPDGVVLTGEVPTASLLGDAGTDHRYVVHAVPLRPLDP